ncbi:MAG: hypothetical protein ABI599_16195 [Flavobacteriales bacterium]
MLLVHGRLGLPTAVQQTASALFTIAPNPAMASVTIQHGLSGTVQLLVCDAPVW